MLKYVVVLILSLTLFAIPANSQLRAVPASVQQRQKIAAEREATNNAFSTDQHQLLQQEQITRAVADRQSQLRLATEKMAGRPPRSQQTLAQAPATAGLLPGQQTVAQDQVP